MTSEGAYRDRGVRLRLFGLLTILIGIGAMLLGLLHLALPRLANAVPDFHMAWEQVLTGAMTFGAIGVVLIVCGTGSYRQRRWVPPAMQTVGWTWLLAGIAVVGFVITNLDDLTILAASGLSEQTPEVEGLILWILLVPSVGFGVALPLLILWAYRDEDLLATCRASSPQPDWSDRCPSNVLVLSLALGFTGLLSLPMALRPVFPFFGRLLTGAGGAFAALLAGGVLVWIGWALFRLKRSGWWATGLCTLVIAVSTAWTLIEIPRVEWYRALEYPEQQIERLLISGEPSRWPGIAATSALTILTLIYLVSIRKHFWSDGGR